MVSGLVTLPIIMMYQSANGPYDWILPGPNLALIVNVAVFTIAQLVSMRAQGAREGLSQTATPEQNPSDFQKTCQRRFLDAELTQSKIKEFLKEDTEPSTWMFVGAGIIFLLSYPCFFWDITNKEVVEGV